MEQEEAEPRSIKDALHNLKAVAGALKESADFSMRQKQTAGRSLM